MSTETTVDLCKHDGQPCYASAGTNDAHWRCGTAQCSPAQSQTTAALRLIHGTDLCSICGLPKSGEGRGFCSYPHARVPVKAVDADHPNGFWTWSAETHD